jgi:hypothetical protein
MVNSREMSSADPYTGTPENWVMMFHKHLHIIKAVLDIPVITTQEGLLKSKKTTNTDYS